MTPSESSPRSPSGADRACGHGDARLGGDRLGDARLGDARLGDARLADELRAVALLALDRLDPVLARLRDAVQPATGAGPPSDGAPAPCPLCVALATLHGGRPEPARRLAEHTAGLIAALRDALAEPASAPPSAPARPARPVQRIPVDREPGAAPC